MFESGFIVERGDPKDLIMNMGSKLFTIIKKMDKFLGKVLTEKIEQGLDRKTVFSQFDCFKIPSWFKKDGYDLPLFEFK